MRHTMGLVLLAATTLTTGCHAKFKKHAHTIGQVRVQVLTTTAPTVDLGVLVVPDTGDEQADRIGDIVEGVVNASQAIKGAQVARQLERKVDPSGINRVLASVVQDAMGASPPFAVTNDPNAPLLQIEVDDYGMRVDQVGMPGVFHYGVRVQIYKPNGMRVYNNRLSCETVVGTGGTQVLVNNVAQLRRMSANEVQLAFEDTAWFCGQELTRQVRQHAG